VSVVKVADGLSSAEMDGEFAEPVRLGDTVGGGVMVMDSETESVIEYDAVGGMESVAENVPPVPDSEVDAEADVDVLADSDALALCDADAVCDDDDETDVENDIDTLALVDTDSDAETEVDTLVLTD
jgi:hypothetical protein